MSDPISSVELIPIESKTRTIQTCFRQCLYEVPNFQRPYSWNSDQLEDFWRDVILAQGDFFFGSTVTWVSAKRDLFNDTYSIIDGQQRLTTSAIILSVIRDAFLDVAERASNTEETTSSSAKSQAAATQTYLITTDDDGKEYPVLVRSEPMFYEHIQRPDAIPSGVKWNNSAERIGEARKFFERRVLSELEELSLDGEIERLKAIRANTLKARVIQVELASEEDGFLIFETLNTRGTDLRISDLIKNLLIRGGAKNGPDRDALATRWDRVVDRVQEGRVSTDMADRFIWQSWNSRRGAVKEPELFKEIGKMVGADSTKIISYLKELEIDSEIYQWLDSEDIQVLPGRPGVRNAFAVPEFVDSVRALAIFNVSVANSTILAIARKYNTTKHVKKAQLIEVGRLVENFHFQFTALTNSGSTGGTRGRYNRFAQRLEETGSAQEVAKEILDLKDKLKASLPTRARTEAAFRGIYYAPTVRLTQAQKVRARKIFIAYVLMAFPKFYRAIPAGQNLRLWSIEHIKPQSKASASYQDPIYSIGNLTLLTIELNSALGNSSLSKKLDALKKANMYVDDELRSWSVGGADAPTDAQIGARASLLATEALDQVWSL